MLSGARSCCICIMITLMTTTIAAMAEPPSKFEYMVRKIEGKAEANRQAITSFADAMLKPYDIPEKLHNTVRTQALFEMLATKRKEANALSEKEQEIQSDILGLMIEMDKNPFGASTLIDNINVYDKASMLKLASTCRKFEVDLLLGALLRSAPSYKAYVTLAQNTEKRCKELNDGYMTHMQSIKK